MPPARLRTLAALLIVCLGTLAAPLDSAVNIAFPSIIGAFSLEPAGIRWVIISYVLTYASLTLAFGKLGDIWGYRRVFVTGLAIAAMGFSACALAVEFWQLVAGRIVQGIGIALTWSCAPALATSLYPETQRTRVLAFYSAAIALGNAIGPLAGGFLVERFGWPVVFWARLPLVGVALALAWLIPAAAPAGMRRTFDWTGALLLGSWLTLLLLAAARPDVPHPEMAVAAMIGGGGLLLVAFLVHEARHPDPIIRPGLFREPAFLGLNLASIAINFAGFAVMLLVPFHLARTVGLDAGLGGLVLGSNAVGIVLGSTLAGRLAGGLGQGRLALIGVALSAAGLGMISQWDAGTARAVMAGTLFAQGLGLGMFQVAYADRVLATLPLADRGVAGSLTLVTRTIGVVGAAAGLSQLSRHLEAVAVASGSASPSLVAFQGTFRMVAGGMAVGIAVALVGGLARRSVSRRV